LGNIVEKSGHRFSFGPWNIYEGADPFGPPVRAARDFDDKLKIYKELAFDAVQFHDDDAVPDLDDLSPSQIREQARAMHQKLVGNGLVAEFVAPRLWEHPMTIDGAFTISTPIGSAVGAIRRRNGRSRRTSVTLSRCRASPGLCHLVPVIT
jgi:hypothetical protein